MLIVTRYWHILHILQTLWKSVFVPVFYIRIVGGFFRGNFVAVIPCVCSTLSAALVYQIPDPWRPVSFSIAVFCLTGCAQAEAIRYFLTAYNAPILHSSPPVLANMPIVRSFFVFGVYRSHFGVFRALSYIDLTPSRCVSCMSKYFCMRPFIPS